jgi:hypothetical protein
MAFPVLAAFALATALLPSRCVGRSLPSRRWDLAKLATSPMCRRSRDGCRWKSGQSRDSALSCLWKLERDLRR